MNLMKKSCEKILVYNILYKILIDSKLLRVRVDKTDRLTRVYDRTRDLALFGSEKYDSIYNRIIYLTGVKKGYYK